MESRERDKKVKGGKQKMSGWLIALIVVVVIFAAGAICCNTIGKKTSGGTGGAPKSTDMKKKMSMMGVGGKIAVVLVMYLAIAITLDIIFAPVFRIADTHYAVTLIVGIALAAVGFALNLAAALPMMKAHKEERLAKTGLYRLFLNPMYVFQIFVTLPGIFLIINSWLAMSAVIPAYIAYRIFVREEYRYLEGRFGEEYSDYRKTVLIRYI